MNKNKGTITLGFAAGTAAAALVLSPMAPSTVRFASDSVVNRRDVARSPGWFGVAISSPVVIELGDVVVKSTAVLARPAAEAHAWSDPFENHVPSEDGVVSASARVVAADDDLAERWASEVVDFWDE